MCYNIVMLKIKTKVITCIILVIAVMFLSFDGALAEERDVDFQVNVVDNLSVTVTTPPEWAHTENVTSAGVFLRNYVGLSVTTNVQTGFTASRYSQSTTNLVNKSKSTLTIPTLSTSSLRSSFPSNYWGYSLGTVPNGVTGKTYGETQAGNQSSRYHPMVATPSSPITLIYRTTNGTEGQDIYFGAKADLTQGSGTYANTVIISVVTGAVDNNNPVTPTDPVNDNPDSTPTYTPGTTGMGTSSGNGTTVRTIRSTSGSGTSTTTEVSSGDVRNSYSAPAGVIEDTLSNVAAGSMLAAGLGTAASVAAASGMFFFIIAGRDEGDEEDEEEDNPA